MEARELRIGNYYQGGLEIKGSFEAKLNLSDFNRVFLLTSDHLQVLLSMPDWLKFIKPIPLTEEWLRKFGMDSLDMEIDYVEWGFDNGEKFNIVQDGIGNKFPFYFEYDLGFGNNRIEIKYVHQLQNLFYCLTGNELELKEEVKK